MKITEMNAEQLERAIANNLYIIWDLSIYEYSEDWDCGRVELIEREIEQLEKITNTTRNDLRNKLDNKLNDIYKNRFGFDFEEDEYD